MITIRDIIIMPYVSDNFLARYKICRNQNSLILMRFFQELGLYYDGRTGTYYYYDKERNTFHFHSQVEFPTVVTTETTETENSNVTTTLPKKRKDGLKKKVKMKNVPFQLFSLLGH